MTPTDVAIRLFLGLVALSTVGRDKALGSVPAKDFRLRLRHWQERLQADVHALTDDERILFEKLIRLLDRRLDITVENWDTLQAWPNLQE